MGRDHGWRPLWAIWLALFAVYANALTLAAASGGADLPPWQAAICAHDASDAAPGSSPVGHHHDFCTAACCAQLAAAPPARHAPFAAPLRRMAAIAWARSPSPDRRSLVIAAFEARGPPRS